MVELNSSFSTSFNGQLQTSSSSGLIECPVPWCMEFFDHDRLMLLHVMCKHPEEYGQLRVSLNADEFFEKFPCARGTSIEKLMRLKENGNNQATEVCWIYSNLIV